MSTDGLRAAEEKMRAAGKPDEEVRAFRSAFERLMAGHTGMLRSAELDPAEAVRSLEDLPAVDDAQALARVALIKLNGGLATSMGLRRPKSLVEARDGHSFLDVIVGQTLALGRRHGIQPSLVLMDSDATRDETLQALARHPERETGLPPDFMQGMVPKLDAEELLPANWPNEPALEWCPPGHGDVYGALRRSGMLAALLQRGFQYAMISNADNLGATLEPRIAGFIAQQRIPFLMEVVAGTEADRKGGHIAVRRDSGELVLREIAQTPTEDEQSFRDYRRWRYYNTNNLWIDLRALDETLERRDGLLELPLIVNRKTVDPRDPDSPAVLQLESAMGAAIESFPGAGVLLVPRSRFVPVKTTDDLLVLRSDVYTVTEEMLVQPAGPHPLPYVELDQRFYRLLDDFEARFPDGPPSLRDAKRLLVRGDVTFGADVVVRGAVELDGEPPRRIDPGSVLSG
ncbi:MAG: UTP--glucose-1-phosphate uridylyltransferase [Solirubrobacteraceae bacterium]